MALTITTERTSLQPKAEVFVFGLFTGEDIRKHPFFLRLSPPSRRYLLTFIKRGFFFEKDETDYIAFSSGKPTAVFLVGLGKKSEWSLSRLQLFSRRLVSLATSQRVERIAVHMPSLALQGVFEADLVRTITENFLLADYSFGKYKKEPKKKRKLQYVVLRTDDVAAPSALRVGKVTAAFTNRCRDMANTPGGDMTPSLLAQEATQLANEPGCSIRILDRAAMVKEKMGAILGVAKGSVEEPKFIIMEYKGGSKSQQPVVLVGKGVTFDSGGINLKPSQAMSDMHMDMSGAAAVLCATAAAAAQKLPVNVVALVPAAENMPSGSGYRPGDILTSRSGITIEVVDTDAEGRILLADALDYAKQYKPQLVVDVATLTGAASVALGQHTAALFSNTQDVADELSALGERSGDRVWQLPMHEEYEQEIKGTTGDVANVGKVRVGGAIHGALFLKRFIGTMPWAHLDIAPTITSAEGQFLAKGASGTGVRLLIRLLEERSERGKGRRNKE